MIIDKHMNKQLVQIVQPGLVGDPRSYWAMHFCSILEALREQKQLKYSFQKSIPHGGIQSIAGLVSNAPRAFFGYLKGSINNFGLQYFLCHYLMSREGDPAIKALLTEVSNAYDFDLLGGMTGFGVFVCGVDSYSGHNFLRTTDAVIFGYNEQTIQNVWRDIHFVDLCILINKSENSRKIAVLGEVEGNNGAKLLRESYWGGKSSFCSFGIGVSDRCEGMIAQTFRTTTGLKTILTLGSKFSVVDDFKTAIDVLDVLFAMGPNIRIPSRPGMSDVIDIIRVRWNDPVDHLIGDLRSMIIAVDSASLGTNALSLQSLPKIVIQ